MNQHEYVVLDIETTGLSKHHHNITEIAAVKYSSGKKVGEFQTLINPKEHIPSFITRLTGITDEMVKGAPTIEQALPDFLNFLGNHVIVAHNATFDYGFIDANASRHLNVGLENGKVCTRKLASRLLPDLPSKRLGSICEHLQINNEQAHRAMGDVKATSQVFSHFLSLLDSKGIKTIEEVMDFEKSSLKKCMRY